jgi:hypothetical protein
VEDGKAPSEELEGIDEQSKSEKRTDEGETMSSEGGRQRTLRLTVTLDRMTQVEKKSIDLPSP